MNPDQDMQLFLNSPRYKHIKRTQELAIFYGRCKEQFEGKCSYPHCACLYGDTGPINPVTGEEYAEEKDCEGDQCKL